MAGKRGRNIKRPEEKKLVRKDKRVNHTKEKR